MEERIYVFVRDFIADHGYSPSYREIADGVGLRSTSTVLYHLDVLAKDGRVDYVRHSPRTVHIPSREE